MKNIARGTTATTDPEIDSVTWTKFGNNMAPLALVANLTTRWRHMPFASRRFCDRMMPYIWSYMIIHRLQFWPPGGATCTDCKFGHQKEPLASVANWATISCIGSKFGQVAPLALVLKLATRLHHCIATLPWIALLALSVGIELVSSSARVTSVKSQKRLVWVTDIRTQRSDPRDTWVR